MTPTLPVDRRYRGCGRIHRRSGTRDTKTLAKILHMLEELEGAGRTDLLRAVRDGQLVAVELWGAYRLKGLKGLPGVEHCQPLAATVEKWVMRADISVITRRNYRYCLDAVMTCAPNNATVADLPRALERYRDRSRPRMFNHARAACRSFAGRYTDLWLTLSRIGPKPVREARGNPQTPEDAQRIAHELKQYGGMWWTMCCTGMSGGPEGSYFRNAFDVLPDRILIHGKKTEGRERVVPRITTPIRPMILYPAFLRHLRAFGVKPNDARKTFTHWMEESGIPRTRRRQYLGHGRRDVTDVYEDYPVERYLSEDGQRLQAHIGRDFAVKLGVIS